MTLTNVAAFFAFAAAAIVLLSCADLGSSSANARQKAATAWYEEQIEEGFGRLDQLPKNWTAVPPQRHAAVAGGSE